jgi:hypothetical protein
MQIGRIQGATRTLGPRQGYLGLPLRDVVINCSVGGAPIILRVLGTQHPPVMIEVGEVPHG